MKKTKQDFLYWATWLILVIIWNYCYPIATPFQDVLVAVLPSIVHVNDNELSTNLTIELELSP